jgi:hypothetical protein
MSEDVSRLWKTTLVSATRFRLALGTAYPMSRCWYWSDATTEGGGSLQSYGGRSTSMKRRTSGATGILTTQFRLGKPLEVVEGHQTANTFQLVKTGS